MTDPFSIHPSVAAATADELFAAGWADYERCDIPPYWQDRRPAQTLERKMSKRVKRTKRAKLKRKLSVMKLTRTYGKAFSGLAEAA